MKTDFCKTCGRAIIWATIPARPEHEEHPMPLDARPVVMYAVIDGYALPVKPQPIVAVKGELGGPRQPSMLDPFPEGTTLSTTHETIQPGAVYVSHYLTCPQAKEHSRGR